MGDLRHGEHHRPPPGGEASDRRPGGSAAPPAGALRRTRSGCAQSCGRPVLLLADLEHLSQILKSLNSTQVTALDGKEPRAGPRTHCNSAASRWLGLSLGGAVETGNTDIQRNMFHTGSMFQKVIILRLKSASQLFVPACSAVL